MYDLEQSPRQPFGEIGLFGAMVGYFWIGYTLLAFALPELIDTMFTKIGYFRANKKR